jgi:hypothetical protein
MLYFCITTRQNRQMNRNHDGFIRRKIKLLIKTLVLVENEKARLLKMFE